MNWNFLSQFDLDQVQENLEICDDEEDDQECIEDQCVRLEGGDVPQDESLSSDED